MFETFLGNVIRTVADPNPASRHSTGIWLLALVKNCPKHPSIVKRKEILQYAFTELLSDDSGNVDKMINYFVLVVRNLFKSLFFV